MKCLKKMSLALAVGLAMNPLMSLAQESGVGAPTAPTIVRAMTVAVTTNKINAGDEIRFPGFQAPLAVLSPAEARLFGHSGIKLVPIYAPSADGLTLTEIGVGTPLEIVFHPDIFVQVKKLVADTPELAAKYTADANKKTFVRKG